MTAGLDLEFSGQLLAGINGLTQQIAGWSSRMDREAARRQRASQAVRQVPFQSKISLTAGTGNGRINPYGPPAGYYWSIRRFTAYNYSAGTVTAFKDANELSPTIGEPVLPFPVEAVNTLGKGELLLNPGSIILMYATGITTVDGTSYVYIWGAADQFEEWLLPDYLGAERGRA